VRHDGHPSIDLHVEDDVSSGTYVRALARDLGEALGVGGHLTALRRTRVGPYGLERARTLDALAEELVVLPLADGALAGQREVGYDGAVAEDDAITEASADCAAGTGDGILPGGAGWVTVRLAPGRYELACNLPGHYAAGMVDELVVR
jgi:hypothetical protein